jgi:DNA modification methylase
VSIIHGDCVTVMGEMEPGSVDAIVTDPPYNIGFMGKQWDTGHGHGPWAEAAYRVAKPSSWPSAVPAPSTG